MLLLAAVWTEQSGLSQTLAGGLAPQRHLHHFIQLPVWAAKELLVCSDPDLRILPGGAVQLQQHRPLEGRKLLSAAGVRVTLTSSPPPQPQPQPPLIPNHLSICQ